MDNIYWEYKNQWISSKQATNWKKIIYQKIEWNQPEINIFGKKNRIPRKTCFLGSEGIIYSYSGINNVAVGWPDWFLPILSSVSNTCEQDFNGCLLNLYRNGSDYISWHSDNENIINSKTSIASLSLGETREFLLKNSSTKEIHRYDLANGDLLIMHPLCQKEWKHSLPKRIKKSNYRINLTFRSFLY